MDRNQVFVEYAKILEDALDWLDHGYRREHPAPEFVPPPLRDTPRVSPSSEGSPFPPDVLGSQDPDAPGGLQDIAKEIAKCQGCNLYLLRENTVPGIGPAGATLMVVTPPPADASRENDSPLAPYEGEYLAKWLVALGLDMERDVFITPGVKCRTPGSRPPARKEQVSCSAYLHRQYKAVAPRAVLALGAAACGALTGNPADFPSMVGQDWNWGAVPALVLWTPGEVLANPGRLRKPVWDALQRLKAAWNAFSGTDL